jgi:hypothetical protein
VQWFDGDARKPSGALVRSQFDATRDCAHQQALAQARSSTPKASTAKKWSRRWRKPAGIRAALHALNIERIAEAFDWRATVICPHSGACFRQPQGCV